MFLNLKTIHIFIFSVFLLLLSSCIGISKRKVYSPNAKNATLRKHDVHYIHGRENVTKKSPADALELELSSKDSSHVYIKCEPIKSKLLWTGFILPILPAWIVSSFIKPKIKKLKVHLVFYSPNSIIRLNTDSIRVLTENNNYLQASEVTIEDIKTRVNGDFILKPNFNKGCDCYLGQGIILTYPVKTTEIENFKLIIEDIYLDNKKKNLPHISFKKAKQKLVTRIIGP